MAMLHVLHNNHQQTHYDCSLGWRIDDASRTLVVQKPGGRWHVPLDNVVNIEVEYGDGPKQGGELKRSLQVAEQLKTEVEEALEWENSVADRMTEEYDGEEGQRYLIDRWLTDIEQYMRDNASGAWGRFFSGRYTKVEFMPLETGDE